MQTVGTSNYFFQDWEECKMKEKTRKNGKPTWHNMIQKFPCHPPTENMNQLNKMRIEFILSDTITIEEDQQ